MKKYKNVERDEEEENSWIKKTIIELSNKQHTWHSYGRKAMLISFKVLTLRAAIDLQISLNSSSGQTENES